MNKRPGIIDRQPVRGGYTPAERWRLRLKDGTTAFMKRAVNEGTGKVLGAEIAAYRALAGAPFLARLLLADDGAVPELWLEDLSEAYWPGTWRSGDVRRVQDAFDFSLPHHMGEVPPHRRRRGTLEHRRG